MLRKSLSRLVAAACMIGGTVVVASPATGVAVVPFPCDGEVYVVQGTSDSFKLYRAVQAVSPITLTPIQAPDLESLNAISLNRTDGLIYGTTYGGEVVKIDAKGGVSRLGIPGGIPALYQNAGDITPDGQYYYRWASGLSNSLVRIDLTTSPLQGVSIPIAGLGAAAAADIALSPVTGDFYGMDSRGQLLTVNLDTKVATRTTIAGMPAGSTYGAAWFDAAGTFYAYNNLGRIFAIDIANKKIKDSTPGPASPRNDGTACTNDVIGLAKQMTAADPKTPTTVTIRLQVDNFRALSLSQVKISDSLIQAFGSGSDWSVMSVTKVSGPDSITINPAYDGRTQSDVLAPSSVLPGKSSAVIDIKVSASKPGTFRNQAKTTAVAPGGNFFGDLSTDGTSSDPNGDGSPGESDVSVLTLTAGPVASAPVLTADAASTPAGTPVTVDVLANDRPGVAGAQLDPTAVRLLDPATGYYGLTVTIAGVGTYVVNPVTGAVTFTGAAGFVGAAPPLTYRVADVDGLTASSSVSITVRAAGATVVPPPATVLPPQVLGSKFEAPQVLGTKFDSGETTDGSLADTGSSPAPLLAGLALLVLGAALVVARRTLLRR